MGLLLYTYYQHQPICAILLATAAGGLIGIERELRGKGAGIRTFAIISMSSCLFTLVSMHAPGMHDTTRLAAQVVSGVGFICAGVIWRRNGSGAADSLEGLTTAASMWGVAAIGMAIGFGFVRMAFTAAIGVLIVMETFGYIVRVLSRFVPPRKNQPK